MLFVQYQFDNCFHVTYTVEHASKPFMKHKAMAFLKVKLIGYRLDNEHVTSHYKPLHV